MMTPPRIPTDQSMTKPGKPPTDRDTAKPAPARTTGMGAAGGGAKQNAQDDDDEDQWRHEPVAPVDEPNPLRSLGKAVGDTITGSDRDTPAPSKR